MLIDARNLSDRENLEADVCIVGAGAAGISLATEFIGVQFKVFLVEGGGLKFQHRSQFLQRGQNSGRAYMPLEITRRRQFGGTTAVWFGRCRPLDRVDFQSRSWIPYSGWPFSRSDLDPFYSRAFALCQIAPPDDRHDADGLDGSGLQSKLFHFSPPTHFGNAYLPHLQRAANMHVLLHANATQVDLDADGNRVLRIRCTTLGGRHISITARLFILAAGGLENPRLLLISRNVHSAGVGNQNDLVGRFFMEHIFCFCGAAGAIPEDFPRDYLNLNFESFQRNLRPTRSIGLPESVLQDEHLLNATAFFVKRPIHKTDDRYYSGRLSGFLHLMETLQHRTPPSPQVLRSLAAAVRNREAVLGLMSKSIYGKLRGLSQYALHIQSESIPNPESRVMLSDDKDALGINQVCLQWRLSAQDLDSYRRFERFLLRGLQRRGFRIREFQHEQDADGWPVRMSAGKHHMGATRMSQNTRHGVVDENCRVHGVDNLFIAGSSVFPTSGMANPTVTIIALAVRLADHVKRILA